MGIFLPPIILPPALHLLATLLSSTTSSQPADLARKGLSGLQYSVVLAIHGREHAITAYGASLAVHPAGLSTAPVT